MEEGIEVTVFDKKRWMERGEQRLGEVFQRDRRMKQEEFSVAVLERLKG